jgi:two-component system, response regulator RegA
MPVPRKETLSRKRILYVDDNQDTCFMMKTALDRLGYDVLVANTVVQGLAIAKSQEIDLYILDFYLTDGIGSDLCLEIRRFDQSSPIVFCSGATSEGSAAGS